MSCNDDCNCGHDHDHEHGEMPTIFLTLDDSDTEIECHVITIFPVLDLEYIALIPIDDETVLLYEYKEDGEEIILDNIEDDDLFEKVSAEFERLVEEAEEEEEEE